MTTIRRLLLTSGVALALAGGLAATAVAQDGGQDKQTVCHIAGRGYVEISVAEPAVSAHLAHGDVLPDEYRECPGEGTGGGQAFISGIVQFFQWLFDWLAQAFRGGSGVMAN